MLIVTREALDLNEKRELLITGFRHVQVRDQGDAEALGKALDDLIAAKPGRSSERLSIIIGSGSHTFLTCLCTDLDPYGQRLAAEAGHPVDGA